MADVELSTLTAPIKTALGISGDAVGTTDPQTLSNKNIPAGSNTITGLTSSDVGLGNVANVDTTNASNISSGTLSNARLTTSGSDATLVTGTAGTSGNLVEWNADGDAVDSSLATSDVVTSSSTNDFTNKGFDANGTGNSLSNVETADIASGSKSGSDATLVTGTAGTNGQFGQWNADGDLVGVDGTSVKTTESFIVACSDETTDLTTGTAKVTFRMPYAFTLTEVRASVTTAPTGSALTVDINESGTTILSTKLTIDATEKTSETAATPPVISDSSLADDAEITVDIDGVGSTVAGAGLKVTLIGNRT